MFSNANYPGTRWIAVAFGFMFLGSVLALLVPKIATTLGSLAMALIVTGLIAVTLLSWALPLVAPRRGGAR